MNDLTNTQEKLINASTSSFSDVEALINDQFPEIKQLIGCRQDPRWHAEGNAYIHTVMVAMELYRNQVWNDLSDYDKMISMTAAILHDIGKATTTVVEEDGSITSNHHSSVGKNMAFDILLEHGYNVQDTLHISSLVRRHQYPRHIAMRKNPERDAIIISQSVSNELLWLLATADEDGRKHKEEYDGPGAICDNLDFFKMVSEEVNCFASPYRFQNIHARFVYLADENANRNYSAFNDRKFETIVMCGLPGAGKSTWIRQNGCSDVISLDAIRYSMGIDPEDEQGTVVNEAKENAKKLLRKQIPFVWDATNTRKQTRSGIVKMMADYGAEVKIVCVIDTLKNILEKNRSRNERVPESIIYKLHKRFEIPEMDEAHSVVFANDGTIKSTSKNPY